MRMLINLILFQYPCRFMKEVSKKRIKKEIKIFISGMITHESDKGMCLAMIVRENLVIL
jgi:hypothetical protein